MKNVKILDIPFVNTKINEIVSIITKRVLENKKTFIVTANPEIVMYSNKFKEYQEKLRKADFIVPDGIGIIMAAKFLNTPLQERIAGYDLMLKLLENAHKKKWKVFILGGTEEVNLQAFKVVEKRYPDINLVGRHHGYFEWENPYLRNEIIRLKPELVLVGLGFPRQENWIADNISFFDKGVFIGVGGSIDVLSGKIKRAPVFWQKMNIEWLYRLVKQPSRWKRMLELPKFVFMVFYQVFKANKK